MVEGEGKSENRLLVEVYTRAADALTRQDKTRQDKTRQDKTRQDKARQDKTIGKKKLHTILISAHTPHF